MRSSTGDALRLRRFRQVDVFGGAPLAGNPLAVVLDSEGLTDEEMQRFTRWANLSETAFLMPPEQEGADYRVRIFTLSRELPFAGHPTLGSCHVWLEAGGTPRSPGVVVQQSGAGLTRIRIEADRLAFEAPPLVRSGPVEEDYVLDVARVLRIQRDEILDAQWADNGPGWIAVLLRDADAVLAVDADFSLHEGEDHLDIGLVGPYPEGSECAYEVRGLFSDNLGRMLEDPVTGSLNASVAQWMIETGRVSPPYVASQGTRVGHVGRIRIDRDDEGTVWVGGRVETRVTGEVEL